MIAIIDKSKNVANVYDTITTVYGRILVIVAGKPRKYYFDPYFNPGDLNMIKSAILSDKYLSNKEKDYLISVEYYCVLFDLKENSSELPTLNFLLQYIKQTLIR